MWSRHSRIPEGMRLCVCAVGGRDAYALRCHRCGLSRAYPRRPSYVAPPYRRRGMMADVAALDAALTALPLERERAAVPARWRDADEASLGWDREYRSWSYRAGTWEAMKAHEFAQAHWSGARLAGTALAGNRSVRRAATRVLLPWLSTLRALCPEAWDDVVRELRPEPIH